MQEETGPQDPFNWTYFFAAVGLLVALPLMHIIVAWFAFYFNV